MPGLAVPGRSERMSEIGNVKKMDENDRKVIEAIKQIISNGNNAEVKKRRDGSLVVYEVKKNIVAL